MGSREILDVVQLMEINEDLSYIRERARVILVSGVLVALESVIFRVTYRATSMEREGDLSAEPLLVSELISYMNKELQKAWLREPELGLFSFMQHFFECHHEMVWDGWLFQLVEETNAVVRPIVRGDCSLIVFVRFLVNQIYEADE